MDELCICRVCVVHVDTGIGTWVCLAPGVLELEPGDATAAQLDLSEAFIFGPHGERVTAPGLAATA